MNTLSKEGVRRREQAIYVAEAMTSLAATWLSTGLLFVTANLLGWGTGANLGLAALQGVVYIAGALLSSRLTVRWRRKPVLVVLYVALAAMTALMAQVASNGVLLVAVLMVWTVLVAMNWPALEALLCHGRTAQEVSRRVGMYNIIWAATGALAIASVAGVMSAAPMGVFYISSALHLASAALVWWSGPETDEVHAHLDTPSELIFRQDLAKRLSRLALPASYTVIYALTPILASLPVVSAMPSAWQSVAVSVWLVVRVATFWAMGRTEFWHTRPQALLGAVWLMAIAFALAAVSGRLPGGDWVQLGALFVAQVGLGVAVGVIYFGSLYFGMVLSHGGDGEGGSTEQGGYHEAMIGAGTVLGPAAGVTAMVCGLAPAVGVGAVVVVSVGLCVAAARRRDLDTPGV